MPPVESHLTQADRTFGRTVVALVMAGFVAVMIAGGLAGYVVSRNQWQTKWVNHSHEVERYVADMRLALEELRSARRGGLLRLTDDPAFDYAVAREHLFRTMERVAELTRDNPAQQGNIAEMRRKVARLDQLFEAGGFRDSAALRENESERQRAAHEVEQVVRRMQMGEEVLQGRRVTEQQRLIELCYVVLIAAGGLLVVVAGASLLVIWRYTRDLTATRDQLRRFNANLEEAVRHRTSELERANGEIQRFAYIISHDLRSPLVNVMGFTAELESAIPALVRLVEDAEREAPAIVSDQARAAVHEDLPEALGFIRSSTAKMDRLIGAVLRLAREGKRTITARPVALSPLAQSVVDGLHQQIVERGATVTVAADMPTIQTDPLALEQILTNIVENAIKYLSLARAGEIRIFARPHGGRVEITVADNGRGIARSDHARIFDLFRRSGAQDQPGEGIGLAHVRTMVWRLGGTISLESELDRGTSFTVDLPVRFAGEKEGTA